MVGDRGGGGGEDRKLVTTIGRERVPQDYLIYYILNWRQRIL